MTYHGALAEKHGGYLQMYGTHGELVATLRGEGNPQVPMSFSFGTVDMHADLLSGAKTTFTIGSSADPGTYDLCLVASNRVCTSVVVE